MEVGRVVVLKKGLCNSQIGKSWLAKDTGSALSIANYWYVPNESTQAHVETVQSNLTQWPFSSRSLGWKLVL